MSTVRSARGRNLEAPGGMKPLLVLALAGLIAALAPRPGTASLQPQMYCWAGDSEFPVACEEEEDDGLRSPPRLR